MTAIPAEANLSDLLNKPKATLARLAGSRRLVLHRRDAEDLVITTAERAAADNAVVRDTTRLFREMIRKDPMVMTLAVQVLPAVFPWVRHLPEDARQEFAAEWLDALSAAGELDNGAAVDGLVAAWKYTAEIYADPELFALADPRYDDDRRLRPGASPRGALSESQARGSGGPAAWPRRLGHPFQKQRRRRGLGRYSAARLRATRWRRGRIMRRNPRRWADSPRHHRSRSHLSTVKVGDKPL